MPSSPRPNYDPARLINGAPRRNTNIATDIEARRAAGYRNSPPPESDGITELRRRAAEAMKTVNQSTYSRNSPNYKPAAPKDFGLGANPETAPVGPSLQDLAKQAMDEKYAGMEGRINTSMDTNQSAFSEAQEKMKAFYGKAAEDRKEPYAKGVTELAGNLANLGMDFTSGDLAKDWDKNERNLQENADLALANDQSWFEKMKTVNKDVYSQLMVELAQTRLAEEAAAASGGGGGGGRGGRGGSSSKGDVKLTGDVQTDSDIVFDNPGLAAAIASMPDYLGEVARNTLERGGGDVNSASKLLADRAYSEAALLRKLSTPSKSKLFGRTIDRVKGSAAKRVAKSNSNTRTLQNTFRSFNPAYQPVNTRNKVNSTGKETQKTTYK